MIQRLWICILLACGASSAQAIEYGDYIDNFDGVAIRSNIGHESNGTWQCVEFVKRYYSEFFGITLPAVGNANQYFGSFRQLGMVQYRNGSANVPPRPGDVLTSNGTSANVGHVAIVRSVSATQVCVAQQNFFQDARDANYCMTLSGNASSGYSVSQFDSNHSVAGWLRPFCSGSCPANRVGNVGWYPKTTDCSRATQWFVLTYDTANAMSRIDPGTAASCPVSCPAP